MTHCPPDHLILMGAASPVTLRETTVLVVSVDERQVRHLLGLLDEADSYSSPFGGTGGHTKVEFRHTPVSYLTLRMNDWDLPDEELERAWATVEPWLEDASGQGGGRRDPWPRAVVRPGLLDPFSHHVKTDHATIQISPGHNRVTWAHTLTHGNPSSGLRFSRGQLKRLLCYLVERREVDRLVGELIREAPELALDLFEEGFPVLGLPDEQQRSAPIPTPEQAGALLSHEMAEVRKRAIAALEGIRSIDVDDLDDQRRRGIRRR